MMDNTKIEWTDATWNPIKGCTRVSEGCRNCYAEGLAARFHKPDQWGHGLTEGGKWTGKATLDERALMQPLRWKRPRRIFVNSLSDLFHANVPDAWIDRIFTVMALCPQHTFQILTKRPERMREYVSAKEKRWVLDLSHAINVMGDAAVQRADHPGRPFLHWPLPNVWLGVSVENQKASAGRLLDGRTHDDVPGSAAE